MLASDLREITWLFLVFVRTRHKYIILLTWISDIFPYIIFHCSDAESIRPRLAYSKCSTCELTETLISKSVGNNLYPHMPIVLCAIYCNGVCCLRAGRFVRFWASGGTKFTKMGDSLPWTLKNCRANFDTASFIHSREIHNHTNKLTQKTKHTNSNWYIHTLPIGICE